MKRITAITSWLFLMAIIHACSKHVTPTPDPVLPEDSTNIPDGGGDDGQKGDEEAPVTYLVDAYDQPVIDETTRNTIYLGAIVTKTDSKSLLAPQFITIEQSERNPVTIYTNIPMDDFAVENVPASRASDAKLLKNIQIKLETGIDQVGSVSMVSAEAFPHRFNYLRGRLAMNRDLNTLFDLGFADTTRLPEDKGRVVLSFKINKATIVLQPPIYAPFLKMDSTEPKWRELFDTAKPQVVSGTIYGVEAYLVMESDSSTERLRLALNRCLSKPVADIISGEAFDGLSGEEQQIINTATAYGYAVGKGSFPHKGKDAVIHYAKLLQEVLDPHNLGSLIGYNLNAISGFSGFHNKFEVTGYTQKIIE